MALIEINWNPPRHILRQFGFITAGLLLALAGTAKFAPQWRIVATIPLRPVTLSWLCGGLALACLLIALAAPRGLRPLYVVLCAIGLPIGWVVSHVIMALLYYGVITPVGLFFRLIGRDALERRFEPAAATYWRRRTPVTDVRRYFRQF